MAEAMFTGGVSRGPQGPRFYRPKCAERSLGSSPRRLARDADRPIQLSKSNTALARRVGRKLLVAKRLAECFRHAYCPLGQFWFGAHDLYVLEWFSSTKVCSGGVCCSRLLPGIDSHALFNEHASVRLTLVFFSPFFLAGLTLPVWFVWKTWTDTPHK